MLLILLPNNDRTASLLSGLKHALPGFPQKAAAKFLGMRVETQLGKNWHLSSQRGMWILSCDSALSKGELANLRYTCEVLKIPMDHYEGAWDDRRVQNLLRSNHGGSAAA